MKKLFFALSVSLAFLVACQSNQSNENTADSAGLDTNINAPAQYCYLYVKDKDTAKITLMSSGTITTGELSYHLFEKDKSDGIFEGENHGDTLLAEYTFNAEGRESVRQVAFLKKGDQLLEGYADVVEKDGKTQFKNKNELVFGKGLIFNKVACY